MSTITYVNAATQRYSDFGAIATSQGHQPGSGEWWKALRTARDDAHEVAAQERDDADRLASEERDNHATG